LPGCCSRNEIQGRAKLGICTKVLSEIQTNCDKKYSLKNLHLSAVQKIKKYACKCRPSEGTKVWRFGNLAPCRVTDSREAHRIVLEHEKTDRSRGFEVTRPNFEG
jgi:hypothetical protein